VPLTPDQEKIARRFRAQADGCGALGSPLYAEVLGRAADDVLSGGPVWDLVAPHASDPGGSMLALRVMGATHRLALTGEAPELAAHYPSAGGDGQLAPAWRAWSTLVSERPDAVAPLLTQGVQTNEVGRAAALLGGFLLVARETGLPLRLLEVGTSAGLNLRWDLFGYRCGDVRWGPEGGGVQLGDPFSGPKAPILEPAQVAIAERAGCDINPLDPTTADGRLTLLSFVWADQLPRFRNLAAACDLAAACPVDIERSSGDAWLSSQLAVARPGVATVTFHSVMLQYLEAEVRDRLLATIAQAGAAAGADAPLAWLRMEPESTLASDMEVRLVTWPGGRDRRLATTHPHGAWVRWDV